MNLIKTWKDKYTFKNVKETIDLFSPSQPNPDYLRWVKSNELHYLDIEKNKKRLEAGVWNEVPALFQPTSVLDLVFDSSVLSHTNSEEKHFFRGCQLSK